MMKFFNFSPYNDGYYLFNFLLLLFVFLLALIYSFCLYLIHLIKPSIFLKIDFLQNISISILIMSALSLFLLMLDRSECDETVIINNSNTVKMYLSSLNYLSFLAQLFIVGGVFSILYAYLHLSITLSLLLAISLFLIIYINDQLSTNEYLALIYSTFGILSVLGCAPLLLQYYLFSGVNYLSILLYQLAAIAVVVATPIVLALTGYGVCCLTIYTVGSIKSWSRRHAAASVAGDSGQGYVGDVNEIKI